MLFSTEENERPKRRARVARRTEELSEAEVAAIAASEVPSGYDHLDDELT